MELKDTSKLNTSVEMGVTPVSERNDPKNHQVYDILFPPKEDEAHPNIESKNAYKSHNKIIFGSVSTLDWLNTWRSLEEN
jgi:hypothetical protein